MEALADGRQQHEERQRDNQTDKRPKRCMARDNGAMREKVPADGR